MANPVQGEVGFVVDGKSYTLKLGTYALAILQRKTGVATVKFLTREVQDWGVADMLSVFHAGLYRVHKMAEEDVADLMDSMGQDELTRVFTEAVAAAFPEAAKGTADPPKKAQKT